MESMEIDDNNESNGSLPTEKENGFSLKPLSPERFGQGLPYAPENWPKQGDIWGWRVGKRIASSGHFLDRYLYPPKRLRKQNPFPRKPGFASKLSIERYIKTKFPNADVNEFFASFSWKIPAKVSSSNGDAGAETFCLPPRLVEDPGSDSPSDGVACKAGNRECSSLLLGAENPALAPFSCDVCCSEPRLCRDCCCILCSQTINLKYGGYSYIKCEAMVGDGYICGHVAHLKCALRSYMAGTVGGSIGLDAEYYCRRCDSRTDLIPHVTRLLQTCKSIDSHDDIENVLSLGACILRDSLKSSARKLLNHIQSAINKLKDGASTEDIWEVEENEFAGAGVSDDETNKLELANNLVPTDTLSGSATVLSISPDHHKAYLKLAGEVEQCLQALRKSQEYEYKRAEEKLYTHLDHLHNLYQQLDQEMSEPSHQISGTEADALQNAVLDKVEQIKLEIKELKKMEQVVIGVGPRP